SFALPFSSYNLAFAIARRSLCGARRNNTHEQCCSLWPIANVLIPLIFSFASVGVDLSSSVHKSDWLKFSTPLFEKNGDNLYIKPVDGPYLVLLVSNTSASSNCIDWNTRPDFYLFITKKLILLTLPLCTMVYSCYRTFKTCRRLSETPIVIESELNSLPPMNSSISRVYNNSHQLAAILRQKRLLICLLINTILFAVCYVPIAVIEIATSMSLVSVNPKRAILIFTLVSSFVCAINPWIFMFIKS
ncbi:hypothetical protein GZH46_02590, partial [Fragariocoptes setiger]